MNIGILAVDSNFPNLALMKISAYHKARGDQVEWYNPLCEYDKVYTAKVFTFTPDYNYYINANQIEKGGTGYDIEKVLPVEVDRLQPDYSIYNIDSNLSYGFLTRGCPNRCKWCVVPKKEGKISPYMDIEEITARRKKAILMDNNILASNYGLQQIEKIIKLGIKVDFNQGLDARLITDEIARLLAKVKWIKRIRFGCDTPGQIAEVERASTLIDKYGYKGEYFLYCILMDFEESFARVNYWKSKSRRFLPHCQPFRDLNNPHQIIPQWQKDMAHWADRKEIYMSCDFKDFSPRKGFYARNTLKYCEMKLNKKTERLIKRRAAELKKLYETPNPEVDKIISELRAEATKRPQNMSKEEEIAYILKKTDENCDHIEIRKILNVSNT
jgi:hypothetical protein